MVTTRASASGPPERNHNIEDTLDIITYQTVHYPEPEQPCNSCGTSLRGNWSWNERRCFTCGRYIHMKEPDPEPGHPFPHNHEPLEAAHA